MYIINVIIMNIGDTSVIMPLVKRYFVILFACLAIALPIIGMVALYNGGLIALLWSFASVFAISSAIGIIATWVHYTDNH